MDGGGLGTPEALISAGLLAALALAWIVYLQRPARRRARRPRVSGVGVEMAEAFVRRHLPDIRSVEEVHVEEGAARLLKTVHGGDLPISAFLFYCDEAGRRIDRLMLSAAIRNDLLSVDIFNHSLKAARLRRVTAEKVMIEWRVRLSPDEDLARHDRAVRQFLAEAAFVALQGR